MYDLTIYQVTLLLTKPILIPSTGLLRLSCKRTRPFCEQVMEAGERLQALMASERSANAARPVSAASTDPNRRDAGRSGRMLAGLCLASSFLVPKPDALGLRLVKAVSVIALAHFGR